MWVTGGVPVTHLRKIMLEELQRRNYAQHTTRSYIRTVEDFARHFNCSPDRLGPRHIREYQADLFERRKLSPSSVAVRLAALRFFYCKTLKRTWSMADTPYPKGAHQLPTILSKEEVAQLIQAAGTSFHRTLLMTLYATGVRRAELTHLKVSDIDSKRMVIHILPKGFVRIRNFGFLASYESSICRDQVLLLLGSNNRDISPRHAAFSCSFSHLSFLLSFDCSVCRRGQAIRVSAKQIGRDLPREVLAAPLFIRKGQMVRREAGRCACIRRC